ncbi:MAG: metallophosphoesterase [Flavobacteriales bacterium]|nr:metallophosphoesterase [Flavobacteriales bacterium]
MKRIFSTLIIALLLTECSTDKYPFVLQEFEVPVDGYKCLIIGDWGRHGSLNLDANAKMMDNLSCRMSINAVLTTGDNFYNNGVDGASDAHWNQSFVDVFDGTCLKPIPWWPSLGNHDVRGNTTAQIDYSQLSDRWNMPATYYDRWIMTEDSVSIHFITVDTSPFVLDYYSDPANTEMEQHVTTADTSLQLSWLDSVLPLGNPDWLVVYGHHPVYAADGRHGSTDELIEKFAPRFETNGVDVYFAGHNHDLELIKTEQKTLYITSGGGSVGQDRIELKPYNVFGVNESGFVLSSFAKDSVQLDFISKEGKRLFSYVGPRIP